MSDGRTSGRSERPTGFGVLSAQNTFLSVPIPTRMGSFWKRPRPFFHLDHPGQE